VSKNKYKNLADFNQNFDAIPLFLQKELIGDVFVQFDNGVGSRRRFVVMFSEKNIKYLKIIESILIDGTFWSVPTNFLQLITIIGRLFGKYYPIAFILMSEKSEAAYDEVFQKFRSLCDCNFKNIILDFEVALKNSLKKILKMLTCSVVPFILDNLYGEQSKE
jgi:hypothetical protein